MMREDQNQKRNSARSLAKSRRGFFLVLVLVVIVMATMAAYSFTDLMIAYDEAAYLDNDRAQAQMLVESGAEATRLILSQPPAVRQQSGGVFSNPQLFQAMNVVPGVDASSRGNVSILAPALDEMGQMAGIRFGLQNESARLNLNVLPAIETSGAALMAASSMAASMLGTGAMDTGALGLEGGESTLESGMSTDVGAGGASLARELLMGLPNMSVDVADAILDFIDEDDEPRDYGAESEYYLSQPNPYSAKNGPLDSVEELLLVRGVTPWMMFGADANRNGVIDPSEQQASISTGPGAISLGWSNYLTVYSAENNKRADGTPRIHVNQDDLETLYSELSEALANDEWASFIVAYRIAGNPPAASASAMLDQVSADRSAGRGILPLGDGEDPAPDQIPQPWSADVLEQMDPSGGAKLKLSQLLDLVGATVTVEEITYTSPFVDDPIAMSLYLPALMGNLSTQDFKTMPGRININECPAELIRGIPMISPEVAEAIIEARGVTSDSENRQYETWPLVEGLVTLEEMKLLMPLVTSGGDVYRAQIVGYFEGKNSFSRAEVIIDATSVNPKVIYWRDLSHLGRAFDVAVLGVRAPDAFQSMMRSTSN